MGLPAEMRYISLFSGSAGLDLGISIAVPAARCLCYVERESFACDLLATRIEAGLLDDAPIWSDVRTFDARPWKGSIDMVIGGFPCQDISTAGKRAGITGERSGLWSEFARIIGEVRPSYVFIENVSALLIRGLDRVLADLAGLGFDAEWGVVSAKSVGATHLRKRVFILANRNDNERRQRNGEQGNQSAKGSGELAHSKQHGWRQGPGGIRWREPEPASGDETMADAGHAERRRKNSGRKTGRRIAASGPGGNVGHSCRERRESERSDDATELAAVERASGEPVDNTLQGRHGEPAGEVRPGWQSAYPPGPGDSAGWLAVIADRPDLAPAIEPGLRLLVDGMAYVVDASRIDQLRAAGNGVVAIQAAVAFRVLWNRLS